MSNEPTEFKAPIIEAVLDIDCDLPPGRDLEKVRKLAGDALRNSYPKFRQQLLQHHSVAKKNTESEPAVTFKESLGAMQFLAEDELQLIQYRPNGFSFNRLAPYSSLDDYLPEIEAAWMDFARINRPVMIRKVGIRMINRILLPLDDGKLKFEDYLQVPPQLPETGLSLSFLGLLEQHMTIDADTKNRANIVKTTEAPKDGVLPLIIDIDAFWSCEMPPAHWGAILERIKLLRDLKNRIFRTTLTEKCLSLFSPPV